MYFSAYWKTKNLSTFKAGLRHWSIEDVMYVYTDVLHMSR